MGELGRGANMMSNPLKNDASRRRCGRARRRCSVQGQEWADREDLLHRHTFYCYVFVVRDEGLSDTVTKTQWNTNVLCYKFKIARMDVY